METPILLVVAAVSVLAAVAWGRSARLRMRIIGRLQAEFREATGEQINSYRSALTLVRAEQRRDLHGVIVYGLLAIAATVVAAVGSLGSAAVFGVLAVPALLSLLWSRSAVSEARLTEDRFEVTKRAEEALSQENLAPRAWASRLAPEELPDFTGFELGRVYQAGSGLMAGDFFDVFRVSKSRIVAVIGDVAGHGIESSITAFQAKYLLRVFLSQFRDPAQALETLNEQMSGSERTEEFISLVVVVFDTEAGTLRFASAGHPTAFLWHEREVQPLRATGPLLMLDRGSTFFSREIPLESGDMVLMYTDGLAEARHGPELYGEDRIAQLMRRDPGVSPGVLCKALLEGARDFSHGPIEDDVAIMAIRRV